MSFWAKLFGRSVSPQPSATLEKIRSQTESAALKLLSDDANKQLVYETLERLEAAGLRIRPTLDRDLIIVRFLCGIADRYRVDDLKTFFDEEGGGARNSPDLKAFWELVSETDAFYGVEKIGALLPKLSTLSDDVLNDMLGEHSRSIFENAVTMWLTNEEEPESYVQDRAEQLAELACGDFEIQSVTAFSNARLIVGRVVLSDGQSESFELADTKRADTTPFFKAMNLLAAHLGKGRFVGVSDGSSDSHIFVYLRPSEQIAFRNWTERQYCVGGPAPVDWLE